MKRRSFSPRTGEAINKLAAKYSRSTSMDWQELRAVGLAASVEATCAWQENGGAAQRTFCLAYARNAMLRAIKRGLHHSCEILTGSPEDYLESSVDGRREQAFRDAIYSLSPAARKLIALIDDELIDSISNQNGRVPKMRLRRWARARAGYPDWKTDAVRQEISAALTEI